MSLLQSCFMIESGLANLQAAIRPIGVCVCVCVTHNLGTPLRYGDKIQVPHNVNHPFLG